MERDRRAARRCRIGACHRDPDKVRALFISGLGGMLTPILASRAGVGAPPGDKILAHELGAHAGVEPVRQVADAIAKPAGRQPDVLRGHPLFAHALQGHGR